MASALRPIGHDDRLSVVEHLDELRKRLIIAVIAFVAATGLCFWQNHAILHALDRPLRQSALQSASGPLQETNVYQRELQTYLAGEAGTLRDLARDARDPALRARLLAQAAQAQKAAAATPPPSTRRPVTLGVGEPFTVTLKVAAYAGLLLALPLLLYEVYAFLLPAFSPRERDVALPLMLAIPCLFVAGVAFCYFLVLPAAIRFLQNFNDQSFDVLIQARDYYKFAIMLMGAMGLLFQIPVGILAATRVGIVSTHQLRKSRRYAVLVCAVLAMAMPGQDPVTMMLMATPMYVLYEASILVSALMDRRAARQARNQDPALDSH